MPNQNPNKRKNYFLVSIIFIGFLAYHSFKPTNQTQLHPFHPDVTRHLGSEETPKKDRPDLAWQQDFLRTMDPLAKRPTPEKLQSGRQQAKAHFNNLAQSRTGTTEFPWDERGPSLVGGRTRALMWDPNDSNEKKVWAGGVGGGLWYTDDIYDTTEPWIAVDDFWSNVSITSIAFDPNDTDIFYVGTGEGWGAAAARGAGIWKTSDGGTTWTQLSATEEFYYVNDLIVRNESGTSALYVGVRANYYEGAWFDLGTDGLYRSTNGGDSFTQVMPAITGGAYAVADIELDADNNLWVATQTNPYGYGGGSILSSDDGTTWTVKTTRSSAKRVEIACAPSNANYVYALVEVSSKIGEVLLSTDGGDTWNNLTEPDDDDSGIGADDFSRGQAWYDLILAVNPNDETVVLAGAIDLFKSSDAGTSWDQLSHWYGGFSHPYVHADQHAIVFKPGSSSDVIFGNDGGVFLSENMNTTSVTFTERNYLYNVTQFYAAAMHPDAYSDYYLAGAQDNGTQKFTQAGLGYTSEASGGDGAFCFIDQNDPDIQITSYVYNYLFLSTNGGASFSQFSSDQSTGSFINPADYDDHLGILYSNAGSSAIGRWTGFKTGSPSRSDISVSLGSTATHLRVSPYTTSSTTLFVGTTDGKIYKIENADGTPSTTAITNSAVDGAVSCIEPGSNEDHLLVTYSNYGITSVWESSDGGDNWNNKEGDLPNMPVRWALYNPNDYNEVILATELGVWRTEDISVSSPEWISSNEGLANVRVDMLQIRSSDNQVVAATHGRGLFTSEGFATNVVWDGESWSNSSGPSADDDVVFNGDLDFAEEGITNLEVNSVSILSGQSVTVNNEATFDVKGAIDNQGSLTISSGASLLTYETNTLTGNDIVIERNTRYANGKYSFVGSPMTSSASLYGSDLGNLVYYYDETVDYGDNEGVNRYIDASSTQLKAGQGYAQARKQLITFEGTPNAGTITYSGTYTDRSDANDGWNLVANPYAAAIDAEAFITENDNTTGSIYIWDDNGSNVERGTNDDYIVINLIGATETDSRAGNLSRYNDHIGSAQGFFVQLSGSGGNDITFTESMRESGNNSDDNFFRNGTIETVRLNLSNEEGLFRQTLIGWVDDISDDEITPGYDAIRFNSSKTSLYSIKDSKDLSIQGVSDLKTNIQLGIELENEGIYQINLDDNNYNGPSLLLYDNEQDVIHHFNAGPYEFTAGADISPTRFVLINSSSATLSAEAKDWTVYAHDNIIHIKPNSKESRLYQLYTLTGQFVRKQKVTEQTQIDINGLTNGVYIIFDGFSSTKIVKN